MVYKKIVEIEYCQTSEMVADIFTKGLSSERFQKCWRYVASFEERIT